MGKDGMNRRSFLKLPALLPFATVVPALRSTEHRFQYEGVLGTSFDLVVWTTNSQAAESSCRRVLGEIDRLASILNTRDPSSEISLFENSDGSRNPSRDLKEVLNAYDHWERRSGGVLSIRPGGVHTPRNVDALGKAYIIDRAVEVAWKEFPSIEALSIDIGGDIVVWGRSCKIGIADPDAWYDNAAPIATIDLENAAVATSGTYARGAHLKDGRTGQTPDTPAAATVAAPDAVTANALATMLCLIKPDEGLQIVESTPGAEALYVSSGRVKRTLGFALLERPPLIQTPVTTNWPAGYQLRVTLPLTTGRSSKRPYVAVWIEDSSGRLVRMLALWGNKSKYYPDLSTLWNLLNGNMNRFRSVTRATRQAGKYELVWDGLDNDNRPVPFGTYRVVVETNQEHGTYARQAGTIVIGDSPTSITLPATANFEPVSVQYGPK
jgi:thiamine biosynthesis lipoprotein ApbE